MWRGQQEEASLLTSPSPVCLSSQGVSRLPSWDVNIRLGHETVLQEEAAGEESLHPSGHAPALERPPPLASPYTTGTAWNSLHCLCSILSPGTPCRVSPSSL
ncbi:Hypothetical predicted protein [Marmota monax]|uniref:Dedicator of cytokinesis protein 2 n=1 Tax=Marmota monax TaxID=9995 RepID=A0A5E4D5S8_MARMO|nr:dedicator of cytokinesis protein 2 [Marmota monax]VTJ89564.1 Hypothetical predicted protein [Marmota monax]